MESRNLLLAVLGAAAIGSLSFAAHATIALFLSRGELVARSSLVARVTVGKSVTSESADGAAIVTRTEIAIKDCLKAPCPAALTIQQLGGRYKDKTQKVLGDGALRSGEDAILFLKMGEGGTAYLTALALSVYHVDAAGLARRELGGLTLMERRGGKLEPSTEPAELPVKADDLCADIARLANEPR